MNPPLVCLGAAHWDLLARTAVPPAPGADVPGRITRRPGGVAFNVAAALAARGRRVRLVAAVGTDPEGERLVAAIAAAGIDARHLLRHTHRTDTYLAIETGGGALHAAVADCAGLEAAGTALLAPLAAALDGAGGLVVDGNLPTAVLAALPAGVPLALVAASPAKAPRLRPALALPGAVLYANLAEAAAMTGAALTGAAEAAHALAGAGVAAALVSDGARAAAWMRGGRVIRARPPRVAARSVTGAGDVLVATHVHALAAGGDEEAALAAALAAASAHVSREPR